MYSRRSSQGHPGLDPALKVTILQVVAPLLHPKSEKKAECGRRDAFEILFAHVCVIYLCHKKNGLKHTEVGPYGIPHAPDPAQHEAASVGWGLGRRGVLRWVCMDLSQDGDLLVCRPETTPARTRSWVLHSDACRGGEAAEDPYVDRGDGVLEENGAGSGVAVLQDTSILYCRALPARPQESAERAPKAPALQLLQSSQTHPTAH